MRDRIENIQVELLRHFQYDLSLLLFQPNFEKEIITMRWFVI